MSNDQYRNVRQAAFSLIESELRPSFISRVLNQGVGTDRVGHLSKENKEQLEKKAIIDLRVPRMMTISGKGSPEYPDYLNVSLLDHSLSVTFGAAYIGLVDMLASGTQEARARKIACVVMATGFAHDVDKYFGKAWETITEEDVRLFCEATRLLAWLSDEGVSLSAGELFQLIKAVEMRSLDNLFSVDRGYIQGARRYVRFADALDSKFLRGQPSEALEAVIAHWDKGMLDHLECPDAFGKYRKLVLFDPHHSFLLDDLARCIYAATKDIDGAPPLVHVIHDNTLVSLLPEDNHTEIVEASVDFLVSETLTECFKTSVHVSTQGNISLTGRKLADYGELKSFCAAEIRTGGLRSVFLVKKPAIAKHADAFRRLAHGLDIKTDFEVPKQGQQKPVVHLDEEDVSEDTRKMTLLALAVSLTSYSGRDDLSNAGRLDQLVHLADSPLPEWIGGLDGLSKRTAIVLWIYGLCRSDRQLREDIFGIGGLLESWFAEDGVLDGMPDETGAYRDALQDWYRALLSEKHVVSDEGLTGRCLITGLPVPEDRTISMADGLYGVKKSAISYREGRPERRTTAKEGTHVSEISAIEYKKRQFAYRNYTSAKQGGIPVTIASTTLGGLFRFCTPHSAARGMAHYAVYDMVRARTKNEKGQGLLVFDSLNVIDEPMRIARFETLPDRFIDQVATFRMLITAAARSGRPLHVFRGLPQWRREFFYADCLPEDLKLLFGGSGLRLEQLKEACTRLDIIETVARPASSSGIGLGDVPLARALCNPASRLESACLVWVRLDDQEQASLVKEYVETMIRGDLKKMNNDKTPSPIQLGVIARKIQRGTIKGDSNTDKEFLLRKAVEAATEAYRVGIRNRDEMVAEVAGFLYAQAELRNNGPRSFFSSPAYRADGETPQSACEEFAREFIDNLWSVRFKGAPPTARQLRFAMAAYRFAFYKAKKEPDNTESSDALQTV